MYSNTPSTGERWERSVKQQAASRKLQRLKLQAASLKPRAASLKLQAASSKLLNLATLVKFQAARGEVHRKDKTILGMFHVERNLVWWESNFITLGYFQLNSEKVFVIIITQ